MEEGYTCSKHQVPIVNYPVDLNTRNQILNMLKQMPEFLLEQIKCYSKELEEVRGKYNGLKQQFHDLEQQMAKTNKQMEELVEIYQKDVFSYTKQIEQHQLEMEMSLDERNCNELHFLLAEIELRNFMIQSKDSIIESQNATIKNQESAIKRLEEEHGKEMVNHLDVSQYQFDSDHAWMSKEVKIEVKSEINGISCN